MKGAISVNSMQRILKQSGAKRVSYEAVKKMSELTEKYARELAKKAVKNALFAGRQTVKREDFLD